MQYNKENTVVKNKNEIYVKVHKRVKIYGIIMA